MGTANGGRQLVPPLREKGKSNPSTPGNGWEQWGPQDKLCSGTRSCRRAAAAEPFAGVGAAAREPLLTQDRCPQVCGKSFNRMYNLLGHMHLHAGSKPFKCPYCSSKFNLKGNLSRHMKVKHGVMDISLDSQGGCGCGQSLSQGGCCGVPAPVPIADQVL